MTYVFVFFVVPACSTIFLLYFIEPLFHIKVKNIVSQPVPMSEVCCEYM